MGLDSVELLMEIENYFGIRIPNAEAEQITTIQKMVDSVAAHLNLSNNSFELRDRVFKKIIDSLPSPPVDKLIGLPDLIHPFVPIDNTAEWKQFVEKTGLEVPRPEIERSYGTKIGDRLRKLLSVKPAYNADEINFDQFVSSTCASNYQSLLNREKVQSLYEIYIAVAGITVDRIGVDIYEISPGKSFTNDLGVD